MKKVSLIISAVVIFVMILSSCGSDASKEVTIGNQVWMAENLNVDKFRNGDPIPEAKTAEEWKKAGENQQPAWCYYDYDASNGTKYGKLYNWYAVNDPRGLAPNGYHIPKDAEWTQLSDYLGGKNEAGTKMKSTSGWLRTMQGSINGTNESGFSGLPGGIRMSNGIFAYIGYNGYWWSSTEFNAPGNRVANYACNRYLSCSNGSVNMTYNYDHSSKKNGFSVRCIRD
jgi:uncharacterized protein (TIGR02145 family)